LRDAIGVAMTSRAAIDDCPRFDRAVRQANAEVRALALVDVEIMVPGGGEGVREDPRLKRRLVVLELVAGGGQHGRRSFAEANAVDADVGGRREALPDRRAAVFSRAKPPKLGEWFCRFLTSPAGPKKSGLRSGFIRSC